MKELTLDELKQIELETLKMFHAFCVENNIRYYLAYGTLLGAIRYKKFIPWDDDVDLLIPREDYDRLITLFKDNERYRLYSFERNKDYHFPFAKLCDMTTLKVEDFYPNAKVKLGVEIDLFPLDNFNSDYDKAVQEAEHIHYLMRRLGHTKYPKVTSKNPLKRIAKRMMIAYDQMLGGGHFVKKIIKECRKESQTDSPYVGAKAWCIYKGRGVIPAEAFAEVIEIEFEGEKFFAPKGYDTYLTCLYGDYLPEPPPEKRKSHHFFRAYRL